VTARRPIRLAVLDDGLFVRTHANSVHPVSATFHRFVEAVVQTGGFHDARYLVPVRQLKAGERAPALGPVDEEVLEVVPTAPFSGIADYLARAGYMCARNWRPISRTIEDSDLLWLRLPASNALLALAAARRARVPHFGWLAGKVGDVARAQSGPAPLSWLARVVGTGYDAVSELAGQNAPLVRLGDDLFSSIVTGTEVAATRAVSPTVDGPPWRIAWAGRMAGEKGLPVLVEAMRALIESDCDVTLVLIGDGPERRSVESAIARLPAGRVRLVGYVGDRQAFLDLLRDAHVFVHPSEADSVPKVLVEAMAAGLPIVAADAGAVDQMLDSGDRGRLVPAGDPLALAAAIRDLLNNPAARSALRERGLAWAADHTAEAQAGRLVAWMRAHFPDLAWPE
jgi:hypothetical protein